jgi:hypothetical protein
VAVFTLTTQVGPVPEQPRPLHPANVAPRFGVAVSVTTVPLGYALEQMEPQVMPDGAARDRAGAGLHATVSG